MSAALDLSVERAFARAGHPLAKQRLGDFAGYLNGLFARHLGRPAFRHGGHSGEFYSATFASEDAARCAMAWAESDLTDMRITLRKSGVTLTGIIGAAP